MMMSMLLLLILTYVYQLGYVVVVNLLTPKMIVLYVMDCYRYHQPHRWRQDRSCQRIETVVYH